MVEFENFGDALLLRDRVYNALKTNIIMGNIPAGQKLNIVDLANQMNISCAPVREALNLLNKDGLVELTPHKRPVVAEGNKEEYLLALELRRMLEPFAARYSINMIPSEKISQMKVQLIDLLNAPTSLVAYTDSDLAVHELLHCYSGSKILSNTLAAVKTYSMRFRYLFKEDQFSDPLLLRNHIETSTKEHLRILDALESRDGDLAYDVVLAHINNYDVRNNPYD